MEAIEYLGYIFPSLIIFGSLMFALIFQRQNQDQREWVFKFAKDILTRDFPSTRGIHEFGDIAIQAATEYRMSKIKMIAIQAKIDSHRRETRQLEQLLIDFDITSMYQQRELLLARGVEEIGPEKEDSCIVKGTDIPPPLPLISR